MRTAGEARVKKKTIFKKRGNEKARQKKCLGSLRKGGRRTKIFEKSIVGRGVHNGRGQVRTEVWFSRKNAPCVKGFHRSA